MVEPQGYATKFYVGAQGDLFLVQFMAPPKLTKAEALTLAAWLVAIADPLAQDFPAILDAVMGT